MRFIFLAVAAVVVVASCSALPSTRRVIPDYKYKSRNMRTIPDILGPSKPRRAKTTPIGAKPPTTKQFDEECPMENPCDAKVVNGEEACPHQFPWLALVLCDNPGWLCTGSFIDDNNVLTAGNTEDNMLFKQARKCPGLKACDKHYYNCLLTIKCHCVSGCTEFSIYGGMHDRNVIDENTQIFTVSDPTGQAFQSDEYNAGLLTHDFGLIPLGDQRVQFNDVVKPICLVPNNDETYEGQYATVAGWGKLSDNTNSASDVPNYAYDRRIISKAECPYLSAKGRTVLCIDTSDSTGVCNGDSGGPLNLQNGGQQGARGPYSQVGIASYVSSAGCESGDPHGFSRITTFLQEIETRTGKKF